MITSKYVFDKITCRAVIEIYNDKELVDVLTVTEASKLIIDLVSTVNNTFYDFTATTPNRDSIHHWSKNG